MNKVLKATDIMADARSMIECPMMAASDLPDPVHRDSMHSVAYAAIQKLEKARDSLDGFRGNKVKAPEEEERAAA
jgi:hypothetical protein